MTAIQLVERRSRRDRSAARFANRVRHRARLDPGWPQALGGTRRGGTQHRGGTERSGIETDAAANRWWLRSLGSARSGQNEGSGRAKLSARAWSSPHEEVGQAESWTLWPGRTSMSSGRRAAKLRQWRKRQRLMQFTPRHRREPGITLCVYGGGAGVCEGVCQSAIPRGQDDSRLHPSARSRAASASDDESPGWTRAPANDCSWFFSSPPFLCGPPFGSKMPECGRNEYGC